MTNVQAGDSQPNAVDLRIGKVFRVSSSLFKLSEQDKQHRGSFEIQPDADGWWNLPEGHYEVVMENVITVGDGEAGWVITRSTLNRNGVFLTSGLYDTGYEGVMAGMMHVTCGAFRVQKGTRIGQYLSFEAESLKKYDGSYGLGKEHDKKYESPGVPVVENNIVKIDLHKVDMTDEELSKVDKKHLNWYQRKRVNAWLRKKAEQDKKDGEAREAAARAELAERAKQEQRARERDAIQAVATHIVVPAPAQKGQE